MKRLLKRKADPSQQPAAQPTAQKTSQLPPPLFSRFASSQSFGDSTPPRLISGPVPLAPRESVRSQDGTYDGSPPKPSSTRVVSAPMQRNRMYEKQPVSGGRDDKPLPDPEQTPTRTVNPHAFRGPVQPSESMNSPMVTDDQPPKPHKSIPEFRRRDDPSRNAEPALAALDASIFNKPQGRAKRLTRTPASSSPERNPPSARPAPAPDHLATLQKPTDRPQPRKKYSPLEAFGLVSGENSPVPSTTTSSVNLSSRDLNSEPIQPSISTTSSDSFVSLPAEVVPTISNLDATPVKNHDSRHEGLQARTATLDRPPSTPNPVQRPQTSSSSNESLDSRARVDQRTRAHQPLGPRSSINRSLVQGQPRIFASMNTGSDFQQEPSALKQGQPRIFAASNGQDSQSRKTNGPLPSSGPGRGHQPQQEPPTAYNSRVGIKGKNVDRSGLDSAPEVNQHHHQPERQPEQPADQTSFHGQTDETLIRAIYTRAKSPAMQYRESLERGRDRDSVTGNGPPDNKTGGPQTHRPQARRPTEPHVGPPPPAPLRKNSSGSSDGRLMGPRGQSADPRAPNLNGDDGTSNAHRRQSLYSPAVNIPTNVEELEFSNEPFIPSPKPSPKTARSHGQQKRPSLAQREPVQYHSPSFSSPLNAEGGPLTANGYSSPAMNDSSPEPLQSRDPRGQPVGWHVQSSATSLSTHDPSKKTASTNNVSISSDREREWSTAVAEPQSGQNMHHNSTQPRRSDNSQARPPPTRYRSQERLRPGAVQTNRGSQMDSFYGGDASLSGMRKFNLRDEEDSRPYPLELHILHPQLLRALLQYLSFYDWCILHGVSKSLRSQLSHVKELKEEVLERYLSTIGYARWIWEEKEPLVISLRDLSEYMRGVSLPTHEYARIADSFLQARASAVSKEERMMHTDQARSMTFATRAYSRIIVRLRAQAEAVMALGGAVAKLSSGPAMGSRTHVSSSSSRAPSPSSQDRHSSRPPNRQRGRMVFASPIYQPKRAPLLRVFVPSSEEWLSDANVLECESELDRAGIRKMLRPGDAVWDIAVGDEGNAGRMVWDGNFLLDLDYSYSTSGDLPKYLPPLAFAPSYFHKVLRFNGNPVVRIDLNPWSEEIAMNLQLIQDRVKTETAQGTYHNVIRWVHRSRFQICPPSNGRRIPFQSGSSTWHIDPGWYGAVVVEAEGTNEGLADLQSRCHSAFPPRNESEGQGSRDEERRKMFRILRERSKPGEIWIRTVGDKERMIP